MITHVYWVGFDYTEAEMCMFDAQQQMRFILTSQASTVELVYNIWSMFT